MTAILQLVRVANQVCESRDSPSALVWFWLPASHFVAVATGPDNVRIGWIRKGKSRFAPPIRRSHPVSTTRPYSRGAGMLGPRMVWSVLHVAYTRSKDLVIYGDVIHLSDGEVHTVESAAVPQ